MVLWLAITLKLDSPVGKIISIFNMHHDKPHVNKLAKRAVCFFLFSILVLQFLPYQSYSIKDDNVSSGLIDTSGIGETANTEQKIDQTKLAAISLPFIQNLGQSDPAVKFYADTFAGTLFVTDDSLTYKIPKEDDAKNPLANSDAIKSISTKPATVTYGVIKERFEGATLHPQGLGKSDTSVNYFVGDRENWRRNVATYGTVSLGMPWPNVSVSLEAHGTNVEKIFDVKSGGNVNEIKIRVDGINSLGAGDDGRLTISTSLGNVSMSKPVAYQTIDGTRHDVAVSYVIYKDQYGFSVSSYDKSYPLVIDPLLASTFIGGASIDVANAIALDSSGNVYVAGGTISTNYPTTTGAYNTTHAADSGKSDAFVSKLNPSLTTLLASTFIGGTGDDSANAIALDSSGNVYVTGSTSSINYPTTAGAYNTTHAADSGKKDVFVSKLNSTLTGLVASTFIGGKGDDSAGAIALDSSGNVYVTGSTSSTSYPTTAGAYQTTHAADGGTSDAFVSKLNPSLTTLLASTFIGGTAYDSARAIALDSSGNVYVTGSTISTNYPITAGAYKTTHAADGGKNDAFVSKLNPSLTTLLASTFIGGTDYDFASAIALDSSGNVYVTGYTISTNYPTTAGVYHATYVDSDYNLFVSKLNSTLTGLVASTFVGVVGSQPSLAMKLDSSGNVYVTGSTYSTSYPTTAGAYQATHGADGGRNDAFVSKLNPSLTTLLASTFIGGTGDDSANAIALDSSGNVYVTGGASSTNYPTTAGAYQTIHAADSNKNDVFVSRLTSDLAKNPPCTVPTSNDWTVLSSCTLYTSATAPANVIVNNGAVLTIPSGITLTIHFTTNHLIVHSGGGVLVKSGGKLN